MIRDIVGVDLSLSGTGVVSIGHDGQIKERLIRTKPPVEKTHQSETERLLRIRGEIADEILCGEGPELVLIEGLAFMARNTTALVQLAGLNYLLRETLVSEKVPFLIVAPTTLKKFIVGKGNAPKDLMLLETYKRYGVSFTDDNLCDAFGLAQCGVSLLGLSKLELTGPQNEVITLLKQQYDASSKRKKSVDSQRR